MNQARFQKQQREKARRERAAMKQARRDSRRDERADADDTAPVDEAAVVAELADLHQRYEAGTIELEEFIAARETLTQKLVGD